MVYALNQYSSTFDQYQKIYHEACSSYCTVLIHVTFITQGDLKLSQSWQVPNCAFLCYQEEEPHPLVLPVDPLRDLCLL